MKKTDQDPTGQLRGLGRLSVEATVGLTELVEAMHRTISAVALPLGKPPVGPTTGITGLVYGSVRGVTRLVGSGVDAALAQLSQLDQLGQVALLAPLLGEEVPSPGREALLAVLNGVLGDHLEASGNPLAIRMCLRREGRTLETDEAALAGALPGASGKLVLLVHGLCMNDAGWRREGHDHGTSLERDLGRTSLYLRYNTGRHVSTNGRELAELLEKLVAAWPVPVTELSIVAHSMGGLVVRSALHQATEAGRAGPAGPAGQAEQRWQRWQRWPSLLRKVVFLGTPHHGTPLERGGNIFNALLGVSPYSHPFTRLGKIRSAGITDLRHGSLLDEDWEGRDRFARGADPRRPVPLPPGVAFYAVAASMAKTAKNPKVAKLVKGLHDRIVGDGLVPVASALGRHSDPARTLLFPPSRIWIVPATNHFDLLSRPEVYGRLREWLEEETLPGPS